MSPWDLAPFLEPGYNFNPVAGKVSVKKLLADMPPNVCRSFLGFVGGPEDVDPAEGEGESEGCKCGGA